MATTNANRIRARPRQMRRRRGGQPVQSHHRPQHALPQLVLHPGATSTIQACRPHGLPCIWVFALSQGSRSLAAPPGPHRTPSATIQPASRLCGRHREGLQPPSTRPHQANCQTRWLRHGLCRSLASLQGTGFARRFKVHDTLGAPLFWNCGYPEGCPLSCVAMALTDWCYHFYQHFAPRATSISFVDNLELVADHPVPLLQAIVAQETFLDMQIDPDKTYLWSPGCPPEAAEPHRIPGQPEGQGLGWTNDLRPAPQNCPPHQHCAPTSDHMVSLAPTSGPSTLQNVCAGTGHLAQSLPQCANRGPLQPTHQTAPHSSGQSAWPRQRRCQSSHPTQPAHHQHSQRPGILPALADNPHLSTATSQTTNSSRYVGPIPSLLQRSVLRRTILRPHQTTQHDFLANRNSAHPC